MFEDQVHDPSAFIEGLREFHETESARRGELAFRAAKPRWVTPARQSVRQIVPKRRNPHR